MNITKMDFYHLSETAMGWKGNDWEAQADRFLDDPTFDWAVCYWFDSAANYILARTFLANNGYSFYESYDSVLMSQVLLTNYDAHNMAVSA